MMEEVIKGVLFLLLGVALGAFVVLRIIWKSWRGF